MAVAGQGTQGGAVVAGQGARVGGVVGGIGVAVVVVVTAIPATGAVGRVAMAGAGHFAGEGASQSAAWYSDSEVTDILHLAETLASTPPLAKTGGSVLRSQLASGTDSDDSRRRNRPFHTL